VTIRLLVCRTCPRYEPAPPPGTPTRGAALGRALKAAPHLPAGVEVRAVNCLAGCRNPCNAAIDAPGAGRLRFSRLDASDAGALLEAAEACARAAATDYPDLPESLRNRITARSPARLGSATGRPPR